ncbi:DUF1190 domain-containing protein [Thalassospira xianhensis]|uniref:Lipoprotein n=1 Tax=Thalassospira xianhensis MCCC 1A02616 TaxID=1177929 RepID=A0A367UKC5_9PROT|nr:DUF1190 domain-containing protein [Thalassospira xianhensis]RCK07784.1 hypothetical protein TH5_01700 [Thalassospira xianhensis MCCC 1A02616]
MKRASHIKAALFATTALVLVACGPDEQASNDTVRAMAMEVKEPYSSVADCVEKSQYLTEAGCERVMANLPVPSITEPEPKFNSRQECEQVYGVGECGGPGARNSDSGGDFWTPFLVGMIVSDALDDIGDRNRYRDDRYRSNYGTQPYVSPKTASKATSTVNSSTSSSKPSTSVTSLTKKTSSYTPPKPPKPVAKTTRTNVVKWKGFGGSSSRSFGRSSMG